MGDRRARANGILLVDQDGHIVLANRQAEEMFGYEPGELLTAEVNQLVPAQIRDLHAPTVRPPPQPQDWPMGTGLDLSGTRRDGTTLPVETSSARWT